MAPGAARWFAVPALLALVIGACGSSPGSRSSGPTATSEPASTPMSSGAAPASGSTTDRTSVPTATVAPRPTSVPTPTAPPIPTSEPTTAPVPSATPEPQWFVEITEISDEVRARIEPTSWRPGCPVGLDALRLLTFPYVDFGDQVAVGELIVAAEWAQPVADVFRELFEARYPIQRVELVDTYGGDDQASMRANNTSGFNCREVSSRPGVWSNHAFGTAIDLNPLLNPYVGPGFVDPPEGAPYADRDDVRAGMIVADDPAVEAFASIGWVWGGTWSGAQDYQHFSANGR